jgi:hypothetical protein
MLWRPLQIATTKATCPFRDAPHGKARSEPPNLLEPKYSVSTKAMSQMSQTLHAARIQPKHPRATTKPFTPTELLARRRGEAHLALAQAFCGAGDFGSALHCCLTGQRVIFGIPRPLAVRDQLHDLACQLEPLAGQSSSEIVEHWRD